jgi:hypothetical protein
MQGKPTSDALRDLLVDAPLDRVSIRWLLDRLEERSFGIVMLLLGIVAMDRAKGASVATSRSEGSQRAEASAKRSPRRLGRLA